MEYASANVREIRVAGTAEEEVPEHNQLATNVVRYSKFIVSDESGRKYLNWSLQVCKKSLGCCCW